MIRINDAEPPPVGHLLAEVPAFLRRPFWAPACRRIARAHAGDGRMVMVIPGFLAGDPFTWRLRRTLRAAGYRAEGWKLGINRGVRPDLLDRLSRRLEDLPLGVVLVGWSLGGLYARELAKLRPERVDRVITLGSPFHGDPRANHAWKMYERLNDHPVDAPPLKVELAVKPPVPTYALWCARDGIVAPAATRGLPGESDVQVEVDCHHTDFCSHPRAIAAILQAISAGTAPPPPPAPGAGGRSPGR
jgi:pimeloyl-ACP methyl ester carboxylesterase